MKMKALFWPLLLILSSLLTGLLVLGDIQGPARVIFTIFFISLCPGMALLRLVFRLELVEQLILAIACSFAIVSIAAVGSLYARYWHPERMLSFLIILTLILAFFDLLRYLTPLPGLVPLSGPQVKPRKKRHRRKKLEGRVKE